MSKTTTKPGPLDLPFGEYLKLPGWGSGSLRAMRRGPPARVKWEREHAREDTPATLLGRLVHCMLLQPELIEAEYVAKPEGMSFASKDGKAWRDAQTATIVSHEDYQTALAIADAVRSKSLAKKSLDAADYRESSLLWTCPVSGEHCKGRPDWIEGRYIYDLKVSRHADGGMGALSFRAYAEGWEHQLAHYRTGAMTLGLDVKGGRLVVVTPKAPHIVYTLEVKIDALDLLELENIATLKEMRACRLADEWLGSEERWVPVEPPPSATVAFGEMRFDPIEDLEETEGS
jgi:exodeoxyribonuclease VIII